MSSERYTGIVNQTTTLRFQFNKWNTPFDVYNFKRVEIYDNEADAQAGNQGNAIETITVITKAGIGLYEYDVAPISTAGTYYERLVMEPEDGEGDWIEIENFGIAPATVPPVGESRSGYAFNNPDFTSKNNWGAIITPDELRYVYGFGASNLSAPDYQTITDETLQWYIDNAVAAIEQDLNFDICKRIRKYRSPHGKSRDLSAFGTADVDYLWEEPYDFTSKRMQEYIQITLRARPVISVEAVEWKDMTGGQVIDLLDWIRINHRKGSLEFFPTSGTLASLPLSFGIASDIFNKMVTGARTKYPDAFFVDYTTGFNNVKEVHAQIREIFPIVGKLAAINMLADYGDGRSPGLASSSISLAGISESYATTQSATNALYGARILQFSKELREFYKNNKHKYSGLLIGVL